MTHNITLFQKYMQKVYAVISCFRRICDFGVYETIQIGRFQSSIIVFDGVILTYKKNSHHMCFVKYTIFIMNNNVKKSIS